MGSGLIFPEMLLIGVFLSFFGAYWVPTRKMLMRLRCLGNAFGVSYYFLISTHSAALACVISFLGSLMQVVTPEHKLKETLYLRTSVAVLLAGTGIFFFWGAQSILPLAASIVSRFSEVQACPQRIRLGFMVSHVMWLIFMWQEGIWGFFVIEALLLLSNVFTYIKNEQAKRKKLALALAV